MRMMTTRKVGEEGEAGMEAKEEKITRERREDGGEERKKEGKRAEEAQWDYILGRLIYLPKIKVATNVTLGVIFASMAWSSKRWP